MRTIFVYADFDWFDTPRLFGELTYDSIRGKDSYGFSINKNWLHDYGNIFLSDDLHNFIGIQYQLPEKDIFSCFSDALPDRWGRTLLKRREQILAKEEKRPVKRLSSFDYLVGIDDFSRMGGFRFKLSPEGNFINSETNLKVPPLTNVGELMHAAFEIEKSEMKEVLPSKKWINQLLNPGSSLGGARPKASVLDKENRLTIAKFPSVKDNYDVAKWEDFAHKMAKKAGINVADTRTIPGKEHDILLSKRFDRTDDGKRIHYASAMTLLGLSDGDNAGNGFGYLDIVDFIVRNGSSVTQNLEELYRRVVFYIIIGNSDDHFRNHGFLLTPRGWELSPAFDINPTLLENQSLLINRYTNESSLGILLDSSHEYMLSRNRAEQIVNEVKNSMKSWESDARKLGLPQRDIDMFAPRFSHTT